MSDQDVTQLLRDWSQGNKAALELLTPIVYDELRRLAQYHMQRENAGHTLQATALVHEAYLRLVDQRRMQWQNRAHFFGIAAQMIRRILVDHARATRAAKRGSGVAPLSLDVAMEVAEKKDLEMIALDDALRTLADVDPQQAKVVELRFFTGLTIEETAEALGISGATVKRDWVSAKAWLFRQMSRQGQSAG